MEAFSELLALCKGNPPVTGGHKGQWRGALVFSLIWVNNRDAGDFRRHGAYYDLLWRQSKDRFHVMTFSLSHIYSERCGCERNETTDNKKVFQTPWHPWNEVFNGGHYWD